MKGFKNIKVKSKTIEDSILLYVRALSFMHGVTASKDQSALMHLINKYIDISRDVTKEEFINTLLFSRDVNKELKQKAHMSTQEYSMFLKRIKDKGLIKENTLNKGLIPKVINNSIGLVIKFENIDDV